MALGALAVMGTRAPRPSALWPQGPGCPCASTTAWSGFVLLVPAELGFQPFPPALQRVPRTRTHWNPDCDPAPRGEPLLYLIKDPKQQMSLKSKATCPHFLLKNRTPAAPQAASQDKWPPLPGRLQTCKWRASRSGLSQCNPTVTMKKGPALPGARHLTRGPGEALRRGSL